MAKKEIESVGLGRIIALIIVSLFTAIMAFSLIVGFISGLSWASDVSDVTQNVVDDSNIKDDITDGNTDTDTTPVDPAPEEPVTPEPPEEPADPIPDSDPVVEEEIITPPSNSAPDETVVDPVPDETPTDEQIPPTDETTTDDTATAPEDTTDGTTDDTTAEGDDVKTEEPAEPTWNDSYIESVLMLYEDSPIAMISYMQMMTILTSVFVCMTGAMTGNVIYRKKKAKQNKEKNKKVSVAPGVRRIAEPGEIKTAKPAKVKPAKKPKKKKGEVEEVTPVASTGTHKRRKL